MPDAVDLFQLWLAVQQMNLRHEPLSTSWQPCHISKNPKFKTAANLKAVGTHGVAAQPTEDQPARIRQGLGVPPVVILHKGGAEKLNTFLLPLLLLLELLLPRAPCL